MIGYLSRVNKTVIIGRVRRTDNLSLIKKEAAEILGSCVASPRMTDEKEVAGILGSCVASPRMTVEKGYCHLEPRAIARGCKDLINKCRDCIELTRLKQVRIKLKRDLYGDFACAQPLKMTMIICLVLGFGVVSESRAATCAWEKDADGNDTTKLVVSGTGTVNSADCPNNYRATATELEIKEGVTGIGNGVFLGASKVTGSLVIPDSVTNIASGAFRDMSGVTSLTISKSITSIPHDAFYGLSGVTGELIIPNSVTSISSEAFMGMSGVTGELKIPDTVTEIGHHGLSITGLTSIVIPDSVTEIGEKAFYYDTKLESIILPEDVNIANNAFLLTSNNSKFKITCLGNMETCKKNFAEIFPCKETVDGVCVERNYSKLIPVTEEQCTGKYEWANGACERMGEEKCNAALNASGKRKYYFDGKSCQNLPKDLKNMECVDGYAKLKNNCVDPLKTFAKKRYTPAEAAQWLNEDNNTVTLTFKKQ